MQVKYFKRIFDEVSAAAESDPIYNLSSDVLAVQIDGTFSAISFKVFGKVTKESENFVELSAINLNSFTAASEITAKGIYEIAVEGICGLKFQIASISGGNATVDIRLVSTGN